MSSNFQILVRRALVASVLVVSCGAVAPALASGAQSFAIGKPGGGNTFPANGNVPYTTTMNFDTSHGAPQRALITTSPGVLAALSANPSCVKTRQITEACHIGDGQAMLMPAGSAPLSGYLVPATDPAHDVAGIDLITQTPGPTSSTTHAEIQLKQNAAGNVAAVLNVDFSGAGMVGSLLTGSTLTVNKTVNGKPFTRMPSNCSPGPSSLTVQYADGTSETTGASPDFKITGCSSLPYAPQVSGTAVKDRGDAGAAVVTTVTQAADEAATAGQGLKLPLGALSPNLSSALLQNSGVPVGTATAVSPLLPAPLVGQVFLIGTLMAPKLTIVFPPPNALVITGAVDIPTSTTAFTGLPDVPQTKLVVTLFGGRNALEQATCAPTTGVLSATLTGQNGTVVNRRSTVVVSGCPTPRPTLSSASLTGLARHKPVLRFRLGTIAGAPKLRAFTVSLPGGLSFDLRKRGKGFSVPGGKLSALQRGKLTVRLKRPASGLPVRLSAPLLVAGKHRPKHLKLRIAVTDASGHRTQLTASI